MVGLCGVTHDQGPVVVVCLLTITSLSDEGERGGPFVLVECGTAPLAYWHRGSVAKPAAVGEASLVPWSWSRVRGEGRALWR